MFITEMSMQCVFLCEMAGTLTLTCMVGQLLKGRERQIE